MGGRGGARRPDRRVLVRFSHSPSAARAARRVDLSSLAATAADVAGWAANRASGVGLFSYSPGVRAGGNESFPSPPPKWVLGVGSTGSRVHGDLGMGTLGRVPVRGRRAKRRKRIYQR